MAERTLKTRISLLIKNYSDWQSIKDSFVPLKGEMCIVNVPASTGSVVNEPCVLFKIGDGVKTFGQLSYSSALAADVYAWAKKEKLAWADMSDDYKTSLKDFIATELPENNTLYQIVADGAYKWKLQKSEDGGTTWTDATGTIDVNSIVTEVNKKVNKLVEGTNGKAYIFNESDGGGAKFEHNDKTLSYVGVNDGGSTGIAAQIYAVKNVEGQYVGSRINVYENGMYYISKANNQLGYSGNDEEMEIVVKKDIKDLAGALHFIGVAEKKSDETYAQAIERFLQEKGHTPKAGDIIIVKAAGAGSKEFIYDGTQWFEIGDEEMYATKAALNQEIADRQAADSALEVLINARKLEILPVSAYGFDTNLRVNQQVDGSTLIDKVISATNTDLKQVVIKSGDYKYNVVSIVDDKTLNIRGFAVETMIIPMATLSDEPSIEKCVFVYNPTLGKTCTFYGKEYTSKEIDEIVDQIEALLSTKVDETDTLILDCNL